MNHLLLIAIDVLLYENLSGVCHFQKQGIRKNITEIPVIWFVLDIRGIKNIHIEIG